ncbi:hypothetical protein [Pseudoalteromonas sp. OANN1]|uniref:hypothetical protein n=1 Tax=Pseudoalteromonas sp. OANN1 TaxID=2954497 RepID=UPI002096E459|nr:hypothetical protein [Pseudoalteromonas sp. OANN1]MCO7199094.1 hypothetical protein [Pseudoalteromonas sp. OANN1]
MELLDNHKALANSNAEFIKTMLNAPERIEEQTQAIRSGEIPKSYEQLRASVSPWPVIIDSRTKNDMIEVVKKISDLLFKSMVILAREYPAVFKAQYKVPIEWFNQLDPNLPAGQFMVGRYDALITRNMLKLVEFNAGTNIGGWHLYHLTDLYRQIVGGSNKLEITQILDCYLIQTERMAKEKLGDIGRPLNLLFEFENENELCKESLNFFTQVINQLDLNLNIVTDINFDKLQVDAERATIDGVQIDIVNVPIFNFDFNEKRILDLTILHRNNKLFFPDNPIDLSTGHKSCFANLHFLLGQNRLDEREARLVSKYIPLTYHLNSELLSLIGTESQIEDTKFIANKDNWVIKRDGLLGGDHVYVGKFTTQSSWENILQLAKKGVGWIVQQYYPSDGFYAPTDSNQILPHDYIFGFFNFGGTYGGVGVRKVQSKLSDGVVNSAKGAQYTAVLEVAPAAKIIL